MEVEPSPTLPNKRLNPFLFPTDTDFRFVLLIVMAVGATLFVYYSLSYYWLTPTRVEAMSCYRSDQDIEASIACLQELERFQSYWMLGGVAGVLGLAILLFWTAPLRKIRRDGLVPLTAVDTPEVLAYLEELCQEIGLKDTPQFLWNPLNLATTGVAFSRPGQSFVSLPGGLVVLFYQDRAAFRAVLLHELAHLWNGDTNKTYLAVSVWQAFVIVAAAPFFVSLLVGAFQHGDWVYHWQLGWRLIPLAVIVILMRNSVLRAREIYADVRASVWDGSEGGLNRQLLALSPHTGLLARLGGSFHPDPKVRRQTVQDTSSLFPLGWGDALATGLAAAITLPTLGFVLAIFLPDQFDTWQHVGAAVLVAPLIMGVAGSAIWRQVFAVRYGSHQRIPYGRLGLVLGSGLLLGRLLDFTVAASPPSFWYAGVVDWLGTTIVAGLLLAGGISFFLYAVSAGAEAWLDVLPTVNKLRRTAVIGLFIVCMALIFWLALVMSSNYMGLSVFPIMFVLALWPPQSAALTFMLVGFWAFPMAASLGQRAAPVERSWVYLDPILPQSVSLAPLRGWWALSAGGKAGVLVGILWLIIISVLRLFGWLDDNIYELAYYGYIGVAILAQGSAAALVMWRTKRLRLWQGLAAAFAAGCVSTICLLLLNLLFGGSLTVNLIWIIFSMVVNGGGLFTLVMGIALLILSSLFPQKHQLPGQGDLDGRKSTKLPTSQ